MGKKCGLDPGAGGPAALGDVPAAWAQKGPIKIGVITAMTGAPRRSGRT